MPIYKVKNCKNKEGLQKYFVRINYIDDYGIKRQPTRVAYGLDVAKDLEHRLDYETKTQKEMPVNKIKVEKLFDEYISVKKYEVRESSLCKSKGNLKNHTLPVLKNVRIDKLSPQILQKWKLSVEKKRLALTTKKNIFGELRTMLNYAVRMDYIPKHNLTKVRKFQRPFCYQKRYSVLYA